MTVDRMVLGLMNVAADVRDDEKGQALVEYSLLILLVAVAALAAVRTFGLDVSKLYQSIVDAYP
jgi:Flp pilus assembly pilin Flp